MKKDSSIRLPDHYKFILAAYLLGMFFFSLFRISLFLINLNRISVIPESERLEILSSALIMGLRFDTVISAYILIVPLIVLTIVSFLKSNGLKIKYAVFYLTGLLYSLSFVICSADIPYFNYYFSRLTTAIFNWKDEGSFMFKMVTQEKGYFIYVLMCLAITLIYWLIYIRKIKRLFVLKRNNESRLKLAIYTVLFLPLVFISLRGRMEFKSPIRVGTAYFSSYSFPNQLGLNPVFTFIRSYLDDLAGKSNELRLMDDHQALKKVIEYLGITGHASFPLSRQVNFVQPAEKKNVVLILMECMSAEKMGRYGNSKRLTPFLDSLANHSYCFDDFYSAGIHTYNGLFSTFYSFPALLRQHPMKNAVIHEYTGLPVTLRDNGYSTVFFTTHDEQFDNMGGFFYSNGFQKVVSQKDYPGKEVLGPTGVPDHIMLEHALKHMTELSGRDKPFFAAMLTASDHGPYIIPDKISFKPRSSQLHDQIVEYADWSLRRFFCEAVKEKWFDNTIFVLLADHGAIINPIYDMPLSFNHSPLIIYSRSSEKQARTINSLCGQIDVFPTVMSLLKIPYINNTMGIDAFNERRPFIYFSHDDKIGVIGREYYYIYKISGEEAIYRYKDNSTENQIANKRSLADSMKHYAFSMMQASQYLSSKKLTGKKK